LHPYLCIFSMLFFAFSFLSSFGFVTGFSSKESFGSTVGFSSSLSFESGLGFSCCCLLVQLSARPLVQLRDSELFSLPVWFIFWQIIYLWLRLRLCRLRLFRSGFSRFGFCRVRFSGFWFLRFGLSRFRLFRHRLFGSSFLRCVQRRHRQFDLL